MLSSLIFLRRLGKLERLGRLDYYAELPIFPTLPKFSNLSPTKYHIEGCKLHRLISYQKGSDVASIKKLPWMGSTRRTSHSGQ